MLSLSLAVTTTDSVAVEVNGLTSSSFWFAEGGVATTTSVMGSEASCSFLSFSSSAASTISVVSSVSSGKDVLSSSFAATDSVVSSV